MSASGIVIYLSSRGWLGVAEEDLCRSDCVRSIATPRVDLVYPSLDGALKSTQKLLWTLQIQGCLLILNCINRLESNEWVILKMIKKKDVAETFRFCSSTINSLSKFSCCQCWTNKPLRLAIRNWNIPDKTQCNIRRDVSLTAFPIERIHLVLTKRTPRTVSTTYSAV